MSKLIHTWHHMSLPINLTSAIQPFCIRKWAKSAKWRYWSHINNHKPSTPHRHQHDTRNATAEPQAKADPASKKAHGLCLVGCKTCDSWRNVGMQSDQHSKVLLTTVMSGRCDCTKTSRNWLMSHYFTITPDYRQISPMKNFWGWSGKFSLTHHTCLTWCQ